MQSAAEYLAEQEEVAGATVQRSHVNQKPSSNPTQAYVIVGLVVAFLAVLWSIQGGDSVTPVAHQGKKEVYSSETVLKYLDQMKSVNEAFPTNLKSYLAGNEQPYSQDTNNESNTDGSRQDIDRFLGYMSELDSLRGSVEANELHWAKLKSNTVGAADLTKQGMILRGRIRENERSTTLLADELLVLEKIYSSFSMCEMDVRSAQQSAQMRAERIRVADRDIRECEHSVALTDENIAQKIARLSLLERERDGFDADKVACQADYDSGESQAAAVDAELRRLTEQVTLSVQAATDADSEIVKAQSLLDADVYMTDVLRTIKHERTVTNAIKTVRNLYAMKNTELNSLQSKQSTSDLNDAEHEAEIIETRVRTEALQQLTSNLSHEASVDDTKSLEEILNIVSATLAASRASAEKALQVAREKQRNSQTDTQKFQALIAKLPPVSATARKDKFDKCMDISQEKCDSAMTQIDSLNLDLTKRQTVRNEQNKACAGLRSTLSDDQNVLENESVALEAAKARCNELKGQMQAAMTQHSAAHVSLLEDQRALEREMEVIHAHEHEAAKAKMQMKELAVDTKRLIERAQDIMRRATAN